jgi:hypothetical protein
MATSGCNRVEVVMEVIRYRRAWEEAIGRFLVVGVQWLLVANEGQEAGGLGGGYDEWERSGDEKCLSRLQFSG